MFVACEKNSTQTICNALCTRWGELSWIKWNGGGDLAPPPQRRRRRRPPPPPPRNLPFVTLPHLWISQPHCEQLSTPPPLPSSGHQRRYAYCLIVAPATITMLRCNNDYYAQHQTTCNFIGADPIRHRLPQWLVFAGYPSYWSTWYRLSELRPSKQLHFPESRIIDQLRKAVTRRCQLLGRIASMLCTAHCEVRRY